MSAVNLNRRLVLEAPVNEPDGAGGFVQSWAALGTLWASVGPRTGRMASGETGAVSRRSFRIVVRAAPLGHSGRPEPGQRFRMVSRTFRVEAVTEQEPDALHLLCDCEEEVTP